MPIPDFDHNNVLPPHLGNPTVKEHLSPYFATTLELVQKYSTSKERIDILRKFISFRERMIANNIVHGFQWLDGSFLQNIEKSEIRAPNDLDLVTFYKGLSEVELRRVRAEFPEFVSSELSKRNYMLDHYGVDYAFSPDVTVEQTRYWLQLFSHRRVDMVWKGMLRVELNTPIIDLEALDYLNGIDL